MQPALEEQQRHVQPAVGRCRAPLLGLEDQQGTLQRHDEESPIPLDKHRVKIRAVVDGNQKGRYQQLKQVFSSRRGETARRVPDSEQLQ